MRSFSVLLLREFRDGPRLGGSYGQIPSPKSIVNRSARNRKRKCGYWRPGFRDFGKTSSVPVLVKIGALWSGPCRENDIEGQMREGSFGEKVEVVQINVEERPSLVRKCGVERILHWFLFGAEKQMQEFQGLLKKLELVSWAGQQ